MKGGSVSWVIFGVWSPEGQHPGSGLSRPGPAAPSPRSRRWQPPLGPAGAAAGRNPRRGRGFRGRCEARPRHGGAGGGPAGLFRGLRQLQLRFGARRAPARRAPGGSRPGLGGQPGAAAAAAARRALPSGVAAARLPLQPSQQGDRLGEPRPAGARGGAWGAG